MCVRWMGLNPTIYITRGWKLIKKNIKVDLKWSCNTCNRGFMVFKATFNNLSVISRLSVLLVHVIGFIMKFNKQYTYLPQMSTTNYQLQKQTWNQISPIHNNSRNCQYFNNTLSSIDENFPLLSKSYTFFNKIFECKIEM
jgi:hypothetical protein